MSQTTKRALEASLKKLLLQKPLNKITINDITEDCGVNRMTFYYHFKDIYDLVDWILVEDASKILEGRQSFETWNEALSGHSAAAAGEQDPCAECLPFSGPRAGGTVSL